MESFSPMRRATIAVVPIHNPIAAAKINVRSPSVTPTAATASGPKLATQKTSTMLKSDSIDISRIVGTDSKTIARLKLPCVKSCWVPRTASRRSARNATHLLDKGGDPVGGGTDGAMAGGFIIASQRRLPGNGEAITMRSFYHRTERHNRRLLSVSEDCPVPHRQRLERGPLSRACQELNWD